MPEISRFFGIVIKMYFDQHPPPHFHAEYGEFKAVQDATFEQDPATRLSLCTGP